MSTLYQSRQLAGLFWLLRVLLGALPVVGITQAPSLFGLPNLREEITVGANDVGHRENALKLQLRDNGELFHPLADHPTGSAADLVTVRVGVPSFVVLTLLTRASRMHLANVRISTSTGAGTRAVVINPRTRLVDMMSQVTPRFAT